MSSSPVISVIQSISIRIASSDWVTNAPLRMSIWSASTPNSGPPTIVGAKSRKEMNPTQAPEPLSDQASHPMTTRLIQMPQSDRKFTPT